MRRFVRLRPFRSIADLPAAVESGDTRACPRCSSDLTNEPLFLRFRICPNCRLHLPIEVRARIAALVDAESFRETNPRLSSADPLEFRDEESYLRRLEDQRASTGQTEAIVTGTASIDRKPIVIAVLDFGFMGGSMGVVVGEKVVRAIDRAIKHRVPLVTIVGSGGARMQEGMLSLMQMAKTASGVQRLHQAGIPYVSILTNPTTGGVFASFSSLGDYLVAEPEALIGFAGPRVVEQFLGRPLPAGSHSAEFLFQHGLIDDIVDRPAQRDRIGTVLDLLSAPAKPTFSVQNAKRAEPESNNADPWDIVRAARDPDRLTTADYIGRIVDRFVEFHGDRESGDDPAIIAGFGMIGGLRIAIVGFERGHGELAETRRHGRPLPEGFRKAQRLMRTAGWLRLPILTFIDTPGAYPGIESEERGLAGEIAETMALMSAVPIPTVAAVIGEGGSGGALALGVADRVVMQEKAIFSVIAPEGASAILYRRADRAAELAEKLKITAADLRRFHIVDEIVPEPMNGVAPDSDEIAIALKSSILRQFALLLELDTKKLLALRETRYREFGRSFVLDSPKPMPKSTGAT